MHSDLVSDAVRVEVADAASGFTLAEIRKLFGSEGFRETPDFALPQSQMRAGLVAELEGSIDYTDPATVDRYLRVAERLLDELRLVEARTTHPWASECQVRIRRELTRAGFRLEPDGRITKPRRAAVSASLANAPTESGIRLAMTTLERSDGEPEERVGAAKELVEATIKAALAELGETSEPNADLPALAKKLHKRLRLDPKAVAPTAQGADTIVRILSGLSQIPHGLAELRNEGYGTGHGHARRISGIRARHADLAVSASTAYAAFILDTMADPEAPWRSPGKPASADASGDAPTPTKAGGAQR